MELSLLLSALGLGLGWSLHCIGMCGPIALSLGITGAKTKAHLQNILYQIGRAITYAFLGIIIGVFTEALQLLVYQDYISIAAGIFLILMAIFPIITNTWLAQNGLINRIIAPLKYRLTQKLQQRSLVARFITGILNGFLPCGAVYVALAAAFGTGVWWQSSIYMFLFGLGTIPLMYLVVVLGNQVQQKWRKKLSRIMPLITVLVGIFFILRGLHLNIPFLSPPQDKIEQKIEQIKP